MRTPGRLATALFCGLASCTRPAVTEQELPTEPTEFVVTAHLRASTDGSPGKAVWAVRGWLDSGLEEGLLLDVGDTLLVDGQPVPPEPAYPSYLRSYVFDVEIDLAEADTRRVVIQPPAVEGRQASPISLVGIGRAGGDTLNSTRGSDLILPLRLPTPLPDPAPSSWSWTLTLIAGGTLLVSVTGPSMPAESLVVPGRCGVPRPSRFQLLHGLRDSDAG
jgi:hypothetical protein